MNQATPDRHVLPQQPKGAASSQRGGSDEEALSALARGDRRAALALLVRAHRRAIHRYCHRILRSRALADDVSQLVFLQAFEDLGSFEGRRTFCSWLYAIAHHRCLDAMKARQRWSSRFILSDDPLDDPADPASSSADCLAAQSMSAALEECLDELPPHVRTAVRLRYQEELSYEEMSRICEERPATLQARVARALPLLRHALEGRGFGP